MKRNGFVALAALIAATAAMPGSSAAQVKAPYYPYCLLEGGFLGSTTSCYYSTLAQCMASRRGQSDTCIVNPQSSPRRR